MSLLGLSELIFSSMIFRPTYYLKWYDQTKIEELENWLDQLDSNDIIDVVIDNMIQWNPSKLKLNFSDIVGSQNLYTKIFGPKTEFADFNSKIFKQIWAKILSKSVINLNVVQEIYK